jgi:RNA polymerase sigma-70 factor (ECF subfamily)
LFDRHHRQVLAYAVRRIGADEAEDVMAEVFTIAWRRRADIPDPALPWLYRAAKNVVLHHQRSLARRVRLHDAVAEIAEFRVPAAEDVTLALVNSVLDQLDDLDAEILRLAVWEDLTPREMAVVLEVPPGTARARLMRARRRAQKIYAALDAAPVRPSPVPLAEVCHDQL